MNENQKKPALIKKQVNQNTVEVDKAAEKVIPQAEGELKVQPNKNKYNKSKKNKASKAIKEAVAEKLVEEVIEASDSISNTVEKTESKLVKFIKKIFGVK